MLQGVWWFATQPAMPLMAGMILMSLVIIKNFHRNEDGSIAKHRLTTVIALSASVYIFSVLAASQLIFNGPDISVLIKDGFGSSRFALLLVVFILDGSFRIWNEFRNSQN